MGGVCGKTSLVPRTGKMRLGTALSSCVDGYLSFFTSFCGFCFLCSVFLPIRNLHLSIYPAICQLVRYLLRLFLGNRA